jgi:hypothetical protein
MLRREIGCRRISWMMWIYNELEDRMHGLEAFWDLVGHGPMTNDKGWMVGRSSQGTGRRGGGCWLKPRYRGD